MRIRGAFYLENVFMKNDTRIYRTIAFPIKTFDYLKQFQRHREIRSGTHMTNSEALALLLKEHEKSEQQGGL